MKLSIITINWNNREGLRQTMDNVLSQTARDQFEYVVVDGGADDGSGEMLEKEYDGKPLTCEDAGIKTISGYTSDMPSWQNTSLVTETALGSEQMIAVSGWPPASLPTQSALPAGSDPRPSIALYRISTASALL